MLYKLPAGSPFLPSPPPGVAREHNTRRLLLCSRTESNCHCRIRNPVSYPLNDESNGECISEPEPRRYQIDHGMWMFTLVDMMEEVAVDRICINARKRDDEMRREPTCGLDGEQRRQFSLNVLEDREGEHALKGMELIADNEPLFDKAKTVERVKLRRMKCKGDSADDDENRE